MHLRASFEGGTDRFEMQQRMYSRQCFVASAAFAAIAAVPSTGAAYWEREVVRTESFDVSGPGTLRVVAKDADIHVVRGQRGVVEVQVEVGAKDIEWAREMFGRTECKIERDGNDVIVKAGEPSRLANMGRGLSMRLMIKVPSDYSLDARTDDGDVAVLKIDGRVVTYTRDGDIQMSEVNGLSIVANTRDGDIALNGSTAKTISLETSDGDIAVAEIDPLQLTLDTRDGDIALRLKAGSAMTMDLRGDEIVMSGAEAFSGTRSEERIKGTVNGGGAVVRAVTRDGDIAVRFSS